MRLAFPVYSRTRDLDRAREPARARDPSPWRRRRAAAGDPDRHRAGADPLAVRRRLAALGSAGADPCRRRDDRRRPDGLRPSPARRWPSPRALRFNVALLAVYAGAVFATVGQGIVAVAIAVVGVYVMQLVAVYAVLFREGRRHSGRPHGRRPGARRAAGAWRCWRSGFPVAHLLRRPDAADPDRQRGRCAGAARSRPSCASSSRRLAGPQRPGAPGAAVPAARARTVRGRGAQRSAVR